MFCSDAHLCPVNEEEAEEEWLILERNGDVPVSLHWTAGVSKVTLRDYHGSFPSIFLAKNALRNYMGLSDYRSENVSKMGNNEDI